jgi:hypothetical protein
MSRRRFYRPSTSVSIFSQEIPEISGHSASEAASLGWRADTHKNEFGVMDRSIDVGTEIEIFVPHRFDYFP